MSETRTESQDFPICPWCEEDFDPDDLFENSNDLLSGASNHIMRCPLCGDPVEIKISLVYSTYKAEEKDLEENDVLEDIKDGYEDDLDDYND